MTSRCPLIALLLSTLAASTALAQPTTPTPATPGEAAPSTDAPAAPPAEATPAAASAPAPIGAAQPAAPAPIATAQPAAPAPIATAQPAAPAPIATAPAAGRAAPVASSPPSSLPPVAPPPSARPGEFAGADDASSGRAWVMPTAITAPQGTFSLADYQLAAVGGSYALTDDFAIGAAMLLPVVDVLDFVGMASAKYRLFHGRRAHAALQATGVVVDLDDRRLMLGTLGGVATYCADATCTSHVSLYLGAGASSEDDGTPLIAMAEATMRLAPQVKGMIEINLGHTARPDRGADGGGLAWYGLRFYSSDLSLDVGLAKSIDDASGTRETGDALPIGSPWVSIQYRGLP